MKDAMYCEPLQMVTTINLGMLYAQTSASCKRFALVKLKSVKCEPFQELTIMDCVPENLRDFNGNTAQLTGRSHFLIHTHLAYS